MSFRFSRREFGKTLAAGAAAVGAGSLGAQPMTALGNEAAAGSDAARPPLGTLEPVTGKRDAASALFREAARDVPIVEHVDVVVCGGGPAGVAAALGAARAGASVRLLEVHGCLGGVWTSGALSWILDQANKPGLMSEIVRTLTERGAQQTFGKSVGYDIEHMKVLLEEMCFTAGVRMQYHTRVVAAARDDKNRLSLVLTESKSGRQAWSGKVFIDTTGDGDVAALAGCGFDYGHKETGAVQPMSLMAILTGMDVNKIMPVVRGFEGEGWTEPKDRLRELMESVGHSPSYAKPTMFHIRDDLFALMMNHEYAISAFDAGQITEATVRARSEIFQTVEALRRSVDGWSTAKIVLTGAQIGVREGRRIHGLYEVTLDDLAVGARHQDAVCRVTFGIDVHSTDPDRTKGIEKQTVKARPYDIPLRALIAKDVDGLMMAGRCISGDFFAHSSYRVTGNAVAMGQAAGVTAALAAASNRSPRDVTWSEVEPVLTRFNYLPVLGS